MAQNSIDPKNNPNVKIPPPLVVFGAILFGVGIDWAYPFTFLPPIIIDFAKWIGAAFVLISLIIGPVLSFHEFRKAKTPIGPDDVVLVLVTSGPFRFSRNPMYLTLLVLQLGAGILMNNAWIVIFIVPIFIWMRWWAIAREERYMIGKFGQKFLDYKTKVRRWF